MLALVLLPAGLNAQQCANSLQWPRWIWQSLEWVDETGYTNDIYDATYAWQQQIANAIVFQPSQPYEDIRFSGAVLDPGTVGNTIPHTQQESQCYQKTDYCGFCMNAAVFFYAEIQIDFEQLDNLYSSYNDQGYVLSYHQMYTNVMSHELGHAMRLDDLRLAFSQIQDCSATSVMNTFDAGMRCGIFGAQTCDGGTFANAYSGWLFDTPECAANPTCTDGVGQGGQSCN
jgi:hypothetical protein